MQLYCTLQFSSSSLSGKACFLKEYLFWGVSRLSLELSATAFMECLFTHRDLEVGSIGKMGVPAWHCRASFTCNTNKKDLSAVLVVISPVSKWDTYSK